MENELLDNAALSWWTIASKTQDPSLVDRAYDFATSTAEWLVKGVPLAIGSGVVQLANIVPETLNIFLPEALELPTIEPKDVFGGIDYYDKHQHGVDLGGFIAGSLAPASLSMRLLDFARTGQRLGRISEGLNFFRSRSDELLAAGERELAAHGAAGRFPILSNANLRAAWLNGTLDDVLVRNTAVALGVEATLGRSSPITAEYDFLDAVKDSLFFNATLGAGISASATYFAIRRAGLSALTKFREEMARAMPTGTLENLEMEHGTRITNILGLAAKVPVDAKLASRVRENLIADMQSALGKLDVGKHNPDIVLAFNTRLSDLILRGPQVSDTVRKILLGVESLDRPAPFGQVLPSALRDDLTLIFDRFGTPSFVDETTQGGLSLHAIMQYNEQTGRKVQIGTKRKIVPNADVAQYIEFVPITSKDADIVLKFTPSGGMEITGKKAAIFSRPKIAREQDHMIVDLHSLQVLDAPPAALTFGDIAPKSSTNVFYKPLPDGNAVATIVDKAGKSPPVNYALPSSIFDPVPPAIVTAAYDYARSAFPKSQTFMRFKATAKRSDTPTLIIGRTDAGFDHDLDKHIFTIDAALANASLLRNVAGDKPIYVMVNNEMFDSLEAARLAVMQKLSPRAYIASGGTEHVYEMLLNSTIGGTPKEISRMPRFARLNLSKNFLAYTKNDPTAESYQIALQLLGYQQLQDHALRVFGRDLLMLGNIPSESREKAFREALSGQTGISTFLGFSNPGFNQILGQRAQAIGNLTSKKIEERLRADVHPLNNFSRVFNTDREMVYQIALTDNNLLGSAGNYTWIRDGDIGYFIRITSDMELLLAQGKLTREDLIALAKNTGPARRDAPAFAVTNKNAVDFYDTIMQLDHRLVENKADYLAARSVDFANARSKLRTLYAANDVEPLHFYRPPRPNFRDAPYRIFVRDPEDPTGRVSIQIAQNAAELERIVQELSGTRYQILTDAQIRAFFKMLDEYDEDLLIKDVTYDSLKEVKGNLYTVSPNLQPDVVFNNYVRHFANRVKQEVRNAVEAFYAPLFSDLRTVERWHKQLEGSKVAVRESFFGEKQPPEADKIIRQMLAIPQDVPVRVWTDFQDFAAAIASKFYTSMESLFKTPFKNATDVEERFLEAKKYAQAAGIELPFNDSVHQYLATNSRIPKDHLAKWIMIGNGIVANLAQRLEWMAQILNIVSVPVTYYPTIEKLAKEVPSVARLFSQGPMFVNKLKLTARAIRDYFSPQGPELMAYYRKLGVLKDYSLAFRLLVDDFALFPTGVGRSIDQLFNAFDWVVKHVTKADAVEDFVRFIAARTMHIIGDAAKMDKRELNAAIVNFTNKVAGNYTPSQRPSVFQGPIGHAIGLFQTYQFNLMQQLFSHIQDGNKRAAFTMLGMQSMLFGLNSLPAVQWANAYIAGNLSANPAHRDLYTEARELFGDDWGDMLLYGPLSVLSGAAFYTRGDINPRQVTILPTSFDEIPLTVAVGRVVKALYDGTRDVFGGAAIVDTTLKTVGELSMNRPLRGLMEILRGHASTHENKLISNQEFLSWANAVRLLGARPFMEAVYSDAYYRSLVYEAQDKERRRALLRRLRSHMLGDNEISEETLRSFALEYLAAGGTEQGARRAFRQAITDAKLAQPERLRDYGRMFADIGAATPSE